MLLLVPLSVQADSRPMAFQHLSVTEGLSQATVMDVLQDSVGYMWFATENGVDRYDGHSITSYRRGSAREGKLVNDYVWALAEDAQRNLWLATNGGGLARWDRNTDTFHHYRHNAEDPLSMSSDRVRNLLVGADGIWAATTNAGLNLLDPQSGKVMRFRHDPQDPTSLPSDGVFALLEDSRGRLWVGTDEGLAWLQPGTKRFTRLRHDPDNPFSLTNNRIRSLFQDRHGGIWIGTFGGGLNLLDRRTGRMTRFRSLPESPGSISNDHIRDILEDDTGRIWVATADGLNMLKPYSDEFASYRSQPEASTLRDNYIMSLYQDSTGVLWVGTRTGGVSRWNSNSWYFGHTRPRGAEGYNVTAFATNSRHRWVGTFGGGVVEFDRLTNTHTLLRKSNPATNLHDDRVMSLLADSQGGLWIGTMNEGVSWRPAGETRFRKLRLHSDSSQSLSAPGAMSLFEDSRGDIWIGTFGGGMTRYSPTNDTYRQFLPGEGGAAFCGEQGRAVIEDHNGVLWMGTENGLCAYDPAAETFAALRHREDDPLSLGADSVYGLHADAQGVLWVGTGGGGLSRLEHRGAPLSRTTFTTLTREHGLSSANVFGILSDHEGQLWMSGNNGLMRYNPTEQTVRTYHLTHGLQGEEFHFGATHKGSDGRLYFGGANGYNEFDPQQMHAGEPLPRIVLSRLLVLNQDFDPGMPLSSLDNLDLTYRDNAFTFEFAALAFTETQTNRFRYRLEGFEEDWVDSGTRRTATYTNLPAGRYVLRAQAATSTGRWNPEALSIVVNVAPPPWASVWAYTFYTAAVIGLLLVFRQRQQAERQRAIAYQAALEEEVQRRTEELNDSNLKLKHLSDAKGEFLARMSHEIRSPINGVLGMAELMGRTDLNSKQRRFNDTIRTSTLSLLDIVNDVLDYSKLDSAKMTLDPVSMDLESLADEVVGLMAPQAQSKGLELLVRVPAQGLPELCCDQMRLRQVLVNLLNNAVKFTESGHVELVIEALDSDLYRFAVNDSGIGIAPANQRHIFDSFAQEDGSTSRRFGGTGLGLSICKQIVELMGGKLELESEPDAGTSFHFEVHLPAVASVRHADLSIDSGDVFLVADCPKLHDQIASYCGEWGTTLHACTSDELATRIQQQGEGRWVAIIDQRVTAHSSLPDELAASRCMWLHELDASTSTLPDVAHRLPLPLARRDLFERLELAMLAQAPTVVSATPPATSSVGGNVLLVEDNEVNQEVFAGMLTELGCSSTIAADGYSALRAVEESSFDVILMDYRLPDIDGLETTRRIRRSETDAASTPIVALTANTSDDDRNRCLDAGMDGFLAKPCTMEALATTLGNWIALRDVGTDPITQVENDARFNEAALAPIRRLKTAGGEPMLAHATKMFERTAADTVAAMAEAISRADQETLGFNAHKLKSACANLGAVRMATLCKQIEQCAATGTTEDAEGLFADLEIERNHAQAWLLRQVSGNE